MTKVSPEQRAFARGMNAKQKNTLRALTMFPFYMSASERCDPELYALIQHKLAHAYSGVPEASALFSWCATDVGKLVMRMHDAGNL